MSLRIVELTAYFSAAVGILTASGPDRHWAGRARRQDRRFPVSVLHPLLLCRGALSVSIGDVCHVDVLGVDLGHHELAKLGELLDLLGGEHVTGLDRSEEHTSELQSP